MKFNWKEMKEAAINDLIDEFIEVFSHDVKAFAVNEAKMLDDEKDVNEYVIEMMNKVMKHINEEPARITMCITRNI